MRGTFTRVAGSYRPDPPSEALCTTSLPLSQQPAHPCDALATFKAVTSLFERTAETETETEVRVSQKCHATTLTKPRPVGTLLINGGDPQIGPEASKLKSFKLVISRFELSCLMIFANTNKCICTSGVICLILRPCLISF